MYKKDDFIDLFKSVMFLDILKYRLKSTMFQFFQFLLTFFLCSENMYPKASQQFDVFETVHMYMN